MNLEELLNLISSTSVDDTKLFFITRALKPNMKRKARAHEKYLYHVFQVDNDEDLREYIYETSISQLKSIVDKNYEMVDYDVLNDDTENLFSYPIQNKVFSFQDVVTNQLQRDVPKIKSIRDLLENAAEYTPAGGKIWLDFKKRGAHTHQFIISDTGCGIPEEQRENIFKPFTEVKDLTQGDGLGLPICSLIATKMNGSLTLDSSYNKGARFVLELHA